MTFFPLSPSQRCVRAAEKAGTRKLDPFPDRVKSDTAKKKPPPPKISIQVSRRRFLLVRRGEASGRISRGEAAARSPRVRWPGVRVPADSVTGTGGSPSGAPLGLSSRPGAWRVLGARPQGVLARCWCGSAGDPAISCPGPALWEQRAKQGEGRP